MFRLKLILIMLLAHSCAVNATEFTRYGEKVKRVVYDELYKYGGVTLYCRHPIQPGVRSLTQLEHVVPASVMVDYMGCSSRSQCREISPLFNRMEADPYNLWPALIQTNQMRSDHEYGYILGETWNLTFCDFEVKDGVVEPSPISRGIIARAQLYMWIEYGLPINQKLMRKWNKAYPETDFERWRKKVLAGLRVVPRKKRR